MKYAEVEIETTIRYKIHVHQGQLPRSSKQELENKFHGIADRLIHNIVTNYSSNHFYRVYPRDVEIEPIKLKVNLL